MIFDLFTEAGDAPISKAGVAPPVAPVNAPPQGAPPKAHNLDPDQVNWMFSGDEPSAEHPGTVGLDYGTLMALARTAHAGMWITLRSNQLANGAMRQSDPYSFGWDIVPSDPDEDITPATLRRSKEIASVIHNAGGRYTEGGFKAFLQMLIRDSLTFDQACFEPLMTGPEDVAGMRRTRVPWGMSIVDGSTIRRAKPSPEAVKAGRWEAGEKMYCQVIDSQIVERWPANEMAFMVRRRRPQLWVNGYGYPELEELMIVLTNILNAETWNSVNFTQGVHASSIIAVKSGMDPQRFSVFRRYIQAYLSGVRNVHKTPVIQLDPDDNEEIGVTELSKTNKEMEFIEWNRWLWLIFCAVTGTDSIEFGRAMGNEGQTSSLGNASQEYRLLYSRERGFYPIVAEVAHSLTHWIVEPIDPAFRLIFRGINQKSEQQRIDLDQKAVSFMKTVDEVRESHRMKPIGGPLGNMILDPQFTQVAMQLMVQEMRGDLEAEDENAPRDLMYEGEDEGEVAKGGALDRLTRAMADAADNHLSRGSVMHRKGQWKKPFGLRRGTDKHGRRRAYVVEVER